MAYYNSPALPRNADLIISAAALVGTLCGQLFWGVMGDRFGRKSTFMITLLILIVATIGQVTSASAVRGASFLVWLVFWRLIVGFGLGGEYPLCERAERGEMGEEGEGRKERATPAPTLPPPFISSSGATIASEFSNRHNRGALVSAVFAMQGFGILMASLVALAVTAAFRSAVEADVLKLDLVWRIMLGLGIVPSVVTLGLRESMPESPEFEKDARALAASATADAAAVPGEAVGSIPAAAIAAGTKPVASTLRGYLTEPSIMKNRNAWVLLGTSMTWLLLDVAFYSQNLFLPDVLRATGFSKFPKIPAGGSAACVGECAKEVWEGVFRSAAGNALVAIVGTVPGYWVTVFTIEKLGRVRIQVMGFTMMTLMLVILAGLYNKLVPPPGTVGAISPWVFLILYSMTFFFANFGRKRGEGRRRKNSADRADRGTRAAARAAGTGRGARAERHFGRRPSTAA